ncbi:MAG: hypothetical protein M0P01_01015 [Treponema sp.]|nr:hypothetical protein [Treponema sp.]
MHSPLNKMFIATGISVASVIIIFLFRFIPSDSLWKGYRIMYVSTGCDSSRIENAMEKAGCKGVIDLASQHVPLPLRADTPEVSLASAAQDKNGYLSRRAAYFFDKEKKYQLYYIPDSEVDKAENAVLLLQKKGISAGIHTQTGYPWLIPVVCLLFAVLLDILAVNRVIFICFSVIPVFFSICEPSYSGASAVCLLLYALFLVQQVWNRKNALSFILTNITVLFFTASSLVIAIMTSLRYGLIFAAVVTGTAAVMYVLLQAGRKKNKKYSFVPVMISVADATLFKTKKAKHGLAACAVFIILLTSILLFSADFSHPSTRMQLPSARAGGIVDSFPSLDDYVVWCWKAKTAPYRSLNSFEKTETEKPKDGDTVVFPQYAENKNGITESDVSLRFDSLFRKDMLAQIDNLNFPAVEKLLKKQGKFFHAGYAVSLSGGGTMYLVLMIISFFIPLFFFTNMLLDDRWSKNR